METKTKVEINKEWECEVSKSSHGTISHFGYAFKDVSSVYAYIRLCI